MLMRYCVVTYVVPSIAVVGNTRVPRVGHSLHNPTIGNLSQLKTFVANALWLYVTPRTIMLTLPEIMILSTGV